MAMHKLTNEQFYIECTLVDDILTVQAIDKRSGYIIEQYTYKRRVETASQLGSAVQGFVCSMFDIGVVESSANRVDTKTVPMKKRISKGTTKNKSIPNYLGLVK